MKTRRGKHYAEFICPECGWVAYVEVMPATRFDPSCLATDPPEECEECGAGMEDVEES